MAKDNNNVAGNNDQLKTPGGAPVEVAEKKEGFFKRAGAKVGEFKTKHPKIAKAASTTGKVVAGVAIGTIGFMLGSKCSKSGNPDDGIDYIDLDDVGEADSDAAVFDAIDTTNND